MDLKKEKLSESIMNIRDGLSSHIQRSQGCLTEGNLAPCYKSSSHGETFGVMAGINHLTKFID